MSPTKQAKGASGKEPKLHPTDHKRGVGLLLSLPEVHDQLFSLLTFRKRPLSWHHDVSISTSSKYAVSSLLEIRPRNTVSSANLTIEVAAVRGHAVMCVERVEQGTQDTTLWGSYVQGDGVGG